MSTFDCISNSAKLNRVTLFRLCLELCENNTFYYFSHTTPETTCKSTQSSTPYRTKHAMQPDEGTSFRNCSHSLSLYLGRDEATKWMCFLWLRRRRHRISYSRRFRHFVASGMVPKMCDVCGNRDRNRSAATSFPTPSVSIIKCIINTCTHARSFEFSSWPKMYLLPIHILECNVFFTRLTT